MKKKSFLITTNIERKFTLKHINFFAGDWCFRFGKLNKRNLDTINIKESIWDNISQREKDYKYLKKLINSHINLLPNYLNKFHNVNYPKKFWRNLLFLWLTYYIPFQYYRWKTLNNIFKEEKNLNYLNFNCLDRKFTSVDSIEFALLASQSDAFNYFHFKRIINFLKENNNIRLNIINKKTKIDLNQLLNAGRRDYHLKIKKHTFSPIKNLIKNILLYLFRNNRFFIRDGFNLKTLFLINSFFRQLPVTFTDEFIWQLRKNSFYKIPVDLKKRNNIKYTSNSKSIFDKYISNFIVSDIPLCYLEGFSNLNKIVNRINLNTNLILSSAKHFHDEIFKLWVCREQVFKGKKFIIFEHGGYHEKNTSIFNYQKLISDKTIKWVKNKSKDSLPIPHFIFKNRKRKSSEFLLFAGGEFNPYPVRNAPGPVSFSSFRAIKDINIIFNKLEKLPKSRFYYAVKNNIEKIHYKEMKKIIGVEKILGKNLFAQYLYRSKLVICSYAQTTFIESMVTGPTILIYNSKQWNLSNKFKKSYKKMKNAKIIFDDPSTAADHINEYWDKIDQWWNQNDVIKSRNDFLNKFDLPKSNYLKRWCYFINKNISN